MGPTCKTVVSSKDSGDCPLSNELEKETVLDGGGGSQRRLEARKHAELMMSIQMNVMAYT